jgi:two-component system response regulator VicR
MTPRILVIDDNQELLDLYQLILEPEGFEVHISLFPFENLVDIERLKFNLIILDYHLNGQDNGDSFLYRLKSYQPTASLPVIIATADERAIRKQETALREQGGHLLLKPFDINDLLQTLHQALQERKG